MPTLAQLITPPSASQIEARLLGSLQGEGFPVTDWESGGLERTMVELEVDALDDLVASGIPTIVGGGFLDYSSGDWLTFVAQQVYSLERIGASFTRQRITLSCEAGAGPVNLNPGDLWALSDSGLRYNGPIAVDGDVGPTWVVPDAGSLVVTFQSEFVNDSPRGLNYVDPAGTITQLQTQVAGLSCDNVAPDFSGVGLTGTGTGSIAPSRTAPLVAPDPHAFDVQIIGSGDLGVATFKYRSDGGSFSGEIQTAATYALPGGTTITFTDGADSPSFIAGDVYNFATPGSPTTQQGTDEEGDPSLRGRCRTRWPSLSLIPTEDRYQTWAKEASSQVTRVRVNLDPVVAGQVNLVLAGQAGGVLPAVVTAVSGYVIAREGIGDLSTVASATELEITPSGTVYAPASKLAAIQAATQLDWETYVDDTDIAGEVLLSTLIQILKDNGCVDVNVLTLKLNGVADNVQLGDNQVAKFTGRVRLLFTWVAVKG